MTSPPISPSPLCGEGDGGRGEISVAAGFPRTEYLGTKSACAFRHRYKRIYIRYETSPLPLGEIRMNASQGRVRGNRGECDKYKMHIVSRTFVLAII